MRYRVLSLFFIFAAGGTFAPGCASAPGEASPSDGDLGSSSSALDQNDVLPPTAFKFTVAEVDVNIMRDTKYGGGFVDWTGLGVDVQHGDPNIPEYVARKGCTLGHASEGTKFFTCQDGGPTVENNPLSQEVVVSAKTDYVTVALALVNVENSDTSQINTYAASSQWLGVGGNGLAAVGSLVGIASTGWGGAIAAVGAGLSIVSSLFGSNPHDDVSCAGGLMAAPPPDQIVRRGVPDYGQQIVPMNSSDTIYPGIGNQPGFTGKQLMDITASGPAIVTFSPSVTWPGDIFHEDWGTCNSAHRITLRIERDWRTGLAPSPKSADRATTRNANELDAFYVRNDNEVMHRFFNTNGGWDTTELSVGWGKLAADTPIASISRTPANLDAFWVDGDGNLWTSWWDDTSWKWHPFQLPLDAGSGTPRASLPPYAHVTAATRTPGNLDVFFVANDGAVWSSYWSLDAPWLTRPVSPPNVARPGGSVAAVARRPTNVDVFYIGDDQRLWTSAWDGTQWNTEQLNVGSPPVSPGAPIAAVAKATYALDVLYFDANRTLQQVSFSEDNGWMQAVTVPGVSGAAGADVSAVPRFGTNIDVAYVGNVGDLRVASGFAPLRSTTTSWQTARIDARNFASPLGVSLVSRANNNLDAFFMDGGHRLLTSGTYPGAPWRTTVVTLAPVTGGFTGLAGKCLDVKNASIDPGAGVDIATCNDTKAQRFSLTMEHEIRATTAPNLCIDVLNADFDAGIVLTATCNDTPAQKWIYFDGTLRPLSRLDKCLDVVDAGTADGTPIHLTACNETAAQTFWPFDYPLSFKSEGAQRCAEVAGAIGAGTTLDNTTCNHGQTQTFTFSEHHEIRVGDYCVDSSAHLATCNGSMWQRWALTTRGSTMDGGFTLQSTVGLGTPACLDVVNADWTPGTPLDVTTCNGTAAQDWHVDELFPQVF